MFTLWKVLHVLSAIVLFGPSFSFPIIGMLAKKGNDVRSSLHIIDTISKKFLIPADIVMPVTGMLMIVASHGVFNPMLKQNRWLLSGIILFVIMAIIGNFIQHPLVKRAVALADAGKMDTPEFGQVMAKSAKIGPVLGVLLISIVVLMVWKPGL